MSLLEQLILFHKTHRIVSHILFWLSVLLVATLTDSYQSHEHWIPLTTFSYYSLTLITQIPTAYFLAYFIIPRILTSRQYLRVVVYFLLGLYILCALSRLIYIYVREPMVGIPPNSTETLGEILTNLPKLFYIYFFQNLSLAVVFLFVHLLIRQYTTQKRTLLLEKQKTETELMLLKAQLNPHFLFNTLNNIYTLSLLNSPATSDSIARLADILDYILYRCTNPYVPLDSEIKVLRDYIELEKLRYDERLQVTFTASVDQSTDIAPLVLLTIVENAFKHGASNDLGSPVITIDLQVANGLFVFSAVNSVAPIQVTSSDQERAKIGLANLNQQLELLYGRAYQLHIKQTNTMFGVTLQIDQNMQALSHEKDSVSASR
ncbi:MULTISPECIES: histidine kinase [unclassified Spirosoma]|uniref:sensor histidine kinase n=1 Tax=unclassified Spirosoma TaxID=2621999 RepID=UPI001AD1280D|nr:MULTISPECIES: histidine kinase [unclassified Spirosoma]MBN8826590.1 histidine kinase [Spirosoma sp.]